MQIRSNTLPIVFGILLAFLGIFLSTGAIGRNRWNVLKRSKYANYRPFIEAMAKVETANFTSPLYKQANNLFGMGLPKKRPTIAKPSGIIIEGQEMARYDTESDSVEDLIMWFDYRNFPNYFQTPEEFVNGLKMGRYFEAPTVDYLRALKSWL